MNKLYNIPCCIGVPLLSAPLIGEMSSFPKSKRKRRCEFKCCQRKKEASIMNKLRNIPCCNGIPLLSAPLMNEMTSFPKSKRKRRCE